MLRIAAANMKSGTGKTTTSVNLAIGLANAGSRVLLVDMDPQGNVAHWLKIKANQHTIYDLLADDLLIDKVIRRDVRPGLDVIPSSNVAFGLESRLAGEALREKILSRRLRSLEGYEYVIVDTGPAMSLLTVNALLYAEAVLLTVSMDPMAIIGAAQSLAALERLQTAFDAPEKKLWVLPTMHNDSTNEARDTMVTLRRDRDLAAHLLPVAIRQDVKLSYAAAGKRSVWEYDATSPAAEDYSALVEWVKVGAGK
jgi:chromosome partitioning protein